MGKIATKDIGYTFFDRRDYISPELKKALEAVSTVGNTVDDLTKESEQSDSGIKSNLSGGN